MNDEPRIPDDAPKPESLSEMEERLAEMDRKIEEQKAASQDEINKIHAGFDRDMDEMDKRLQAARKKDEQRQVKATESGMGSGQGRSLGVGLTIAYAIIGAPLAGYGVGWLIDRSLGMANAWSAGLTLVGACGGVFFAIMVAQRQNK